MECWLKIKDKDKEPPIVGLGNLPVYDAIFLWKDKPYRIRRHLEEQYENPEFKAKVVAQSIENRKAKYIKNLVEKDAAFRDEDEETHTELKFAYINNLTENRNLMKVENIVPVISKQYNT